MLNIYHRKRIRDARGFTVTELVVAAGLLVVVLSVVTSLTVSSGRLRQDSRHYRLAVDELSNQLEWLITIDEARRAEAIESLSPSPQARDMLPNPVLSAERLSDKHGNRIALHLAWDRLGKSTPVTLIGWINALPAAVTTDAEKDQS